MNLFRDECDVVGYQATSDVPMDLIVSYSSDDVHKEHAIDGCYAIRGVYLTVQRDYTGYDPADISAGRVKLSADPYVYGNMAADGRIEHRILYENQEDILKILKTGYLDAPEGMPLHVETIDVSDGETVAFCIRAALSNGIIQAGSLSRSKNQEKNAGKDAHTLLREQEALAALAAKAAGC